MNLSMRLSAALVAALICVVALLPAARDLPEHGDESQYSWSAAYFSGRLARLEFGPGGAEPMTDPGWAPISYWTATQPMGTRLLFGAVMGLTDSPAPTVPYLYDEPAFQGEDSRTPSRTLMVLRLAAITAAAAGFSLVAWRWGWRGLSCCALLAIPHLRDDLARAWAESPLWLALCLCAVTYGSRWFAPLCGAAAAFKLTALGLWPVAVLAAPGHKTLRRRMMARGLALAYVLAVWTALTPPAWFDGGPFYLALMLANRAYEHAGQSAVHGGPLGLYLPSRYWLPVELLTAMLVVHGAPIALGRVKSALRSWVGPRASHTMASNPAA